MILLLLCFGLVASASEVHSREQEPDPSEIRPFKMPAMIKHVCASLRGLLDEKMRLGVEIRNSLELSQHFVRQFDTNGDICISGYEIRDIAAHFGGALAGYRAIFQHVLDEDRNGCVETEELSALVRDCMMSSAGWRAEDRGQGSDRRAEMARIMEQTEPVEEVVEEDIIEGEEEEEEEVTTLQEEELTEGEAEDRRAIIDSEKTAKMNNELNEGVKEMICSLIRLEDEEVELGARKIVDILKTEDSSGFDYNEVFEFLGQVGMGRNEVDDLSKIMDANKDEFVTVEEMLTALDSCPVPEYVEAPIVNTRPMIPVDHVACPSQGNVYKGFRTRAMKFIGTRTMQFEGAQEAAREFYVSIARDLENVITPKDMDIPLSCVQECWKNVDSNQDGFLDLFEFERIALDVFEEFLPKAESKTTIARVKLDKSKQVNFGDVPRAQLDLLVETANKVFGELGESVPEGDMDAVVGYLLKDTGVTAFLDKLQNHPHGLEEEENLLVQLIRPIIYQLNAQ